MKSFARLIFYTDSSSDSIDYFVFDVISSSNLHFPFTIFCFSFCIKK